MTASSPPMPRNRLPRRRRGAAAALVLLACLGAAPAPPGTTPGPAPPSLDALAGRPSNRFT